MEMSRTCISHCLVEDLNQSSNQMNKEGIPAVWSGLNICKYNSSTPAGAIMELDHTTRWI